MNKEKLRGLIQGDPKEVERYTLYCSKLLIDAKSSIWFSKKTDQELAEGFRKVTLDGLVFDGVHVTWQSTGISYDYVAYKKKMYIVYPESEFDAGIVYKGDTFSFRKENGKVIYSHSLANPFEKKESEIIGAYAIVMNKRGEFIVTLTNTEIAKHRKVAKTDFIWSAWFSEMVMKTVAKKICKQFFADEFQEMEEIDNENYDLDKFSYIEEIKAIDNLNDLVSYYNENKGKGKEFDMALIERKKELIEERQKRSITPQENENP